MESQDRDKTSKPQSTDCGKDIDYNKLTIDNFEMISFSHLFEVQLSYLIDHAVGSIFNEESYVKVWKGKLSDISRQQFHDCRTTGEMPSLEESLVVLVKPDALRDLQKCLKIEFDASLENIQFIPIVDTLFKELKEDAEDLRP